MERQLYVPALILLGDFQRAGAGLIGACTGVGQVFCAVPDRRPGGAAVCGGFQRKGHAPCEQSRAAEGIVKGERCRGVRKRHHRRNQIFVLPDAAGPGIFVIQVAVYPGGIGAVEVGVLGHVPGVIFAAGIGRLDGPTLGGKRTFFEILVQ